MISPTDGFTIQPVIIMKKKLTIRQVFANAGRMSDPAWYILKTSLFISLMLLSCGLMFTLGDPRAPEYHHWMNLANACYEIPEGVLLIGIIAAAVAEDQHGRR